LGHPKVIPWLLALLLLLPGCASVRWGLQKSFRDPGERLETFPELVWEEYDCAKQKRPFFAMEENELVPPRLKAGKAFNHRMVYVMCPRKPTEVVEGRLQTRIRFEGDPIVQETTEAYSLKPGRWVIDSEVVLPPEASHGVYRYELVFDSAAVRFDKRLTFVVDQ
jgi:hypothetical protein